MRCFFHVWGAWALGIKFPMDFVCSFCLIFEIFRNRWPNLGNVQQRESFLFFLSIHHTLRVRSSQEYFHPRYMDLTTWLSNLYSSMSRIVTKFWSWLYLRTLPEKIIKSNNKNVKSLKIQKNLWVAFYLYPRFGEDLHWHANQIFWWRWRLVAVFQMILTLV